MEALDLIAFPKSGDAATYPKQLDIEGKKGHNGKGKKRFTAHS